MKPTREKIIDLFNEDGYEEIDRTKHHRHNYEFIDIVVPFDGGFYQTMYVQTADDGIDYTMSFEDVEEVEKVEVVTIQWQSVKNKGK